MGAVISVSGLDYVVRGRAILRDVTFEITRGKFVVVVGENGAGKTTLLRLLAGLSKPTRGKIFVEGIETGVDDPALRERIAYLSERTAPPIDWTVREFLDFNRVFYAAYSTERERALLAMFRLDERARFGQLSTGETRRAQVVAALSFNPRLVLIDEITAVLDIVGRSRFLSALREDTGATIVMATNIVDDVDLYATDVILLHRGRLALQTPREALRGDAPNTTEALARFIEKEEGA